MNPLLSILQLSKRWLAPRNGGWFNFVAIGATWLCATVAIAMCFRGRGPHRQWISLALIIPALRLVLDPVCRSAARQRIQRYYAEVQEYSQHGTKLPWPAILILIVVPVAVLNLMSNNTITSGDTWPVVVTATNFVTEGDVNISAYVPTVPSGYIAPDEKLPYCVWRKGDAFYSSYPAGMTFFAVPMCAVSRLVGADLTLYKVRTRLEKWIAAWIAGFSVGMFFLIALRLSDPHSALIASGLLASGSAMCSTVGHSLFQHGGVIFWGLLALALEFQPAARRRLSVTLLQGMALGMMLSCRLSSALIIGPMGLWIGLRSIPRGLTLTAGIALGYLPWALFYATIYGSPLGPSEAQMDGSNWGEFDYVCPVLFSPGAGLMVYQPWLWLLLLQPVLWLFRIQLPADEREKPLAWPWTCLSILLLQVALVANWKCWWGGDCWGSRLCSEAIPFAALLCLGPIAFLRQRRWGLTLLLILAVAAAYLHIFQTYFRDGIDRPVEELRNWAKAAFLPKI